MRAKDVNEMNQMLLITSIQMILSQFWFSKLATNLLSYLWDFYFYFTSLLEYFI